MLNEMKIKINILNEVMESKKIPTEYAKVLYDWESASGVLSDNSSAPPIPSAGYVYNNLLSYSNHIIDEDPARRNISSKPGVSVRPGENDTSLVLSPPPSGNFNGDALMQIGNKVEYQDWTFFLNFEETAGQDTSNLNKARVLLSSMQTPGDASGFMVGINGGGQLFFECSGSSPKSLGKRLERRNLISASYYNSTKTLTLGVYDPIEKKGTYKSYNIEYAVDERWYIGGTLTDLTNNNDYKQFNGHIDNFLLLSGYLNPEYLDGLSPVFFLTGFKPSYQQGTLGKGAIPTGYSEAQVEDGVKIVGYTSQAVAGAPGFEEMVPQYGPQYKTVGSYSSGGEEITLSTSAFLKAEYQYDETYVQSYAASGTPPLMAGNDIQPLGVLINSADTGIEITPMSNNQQITQGVGIEGKVESETSLTVYRGTTCDVSISGDEELYFYAPCDETATNGGAASLIPIASVQDSGEVAGVNCSQRSDDKVTQCVFNVELVDAHPSSTVLHVFWKTPEDGNACLGWPCPGVTAAAPVPAAAPAPPTTTIDPSSFSYWGYECGGEEQAYAFIDNGNDIASSLPGWPDQWMTGWIVKITADGEDKCLDGDSVKKEMGDNGEGIDTTNYLQSSPRYNTCAECGVTTTSTTTSTTPPPKLCEYDIEASMTWTNGLDLDIYVKTEGTCDEIATTCMTSSSTGDSVIYWGNINGYMCKGSPYEHGQLSLNHDAHPTCNSTPVSPEEVTGTIKEPRTFWVWWNRHSNCTEEGLNANELPDWGTGGEPSITITNKIAPTDPITNESLSVRITSKQSALSSSLITKDGADTYALTAMNDGTWEGIYVLDAQQVLKIHQIPQVLDGNGNNVHGAQNNWLDGLKIEAYDCVCNGGTS